MKDDFHLQWIIALKAFLSFCLLFHSISIKTQSRLEELYNQSFMTWGQTPLTTPALYIYL